MQIKTLNLRNRHLLVWDALFLTATPFMAYVVRFEGVAWSAAHTGTAVAYVLLSVPLKLGILVALGIYRQLWHHASATDMWKILRGAAVSAAACGVLGVVILPATALTPVRVPISVLFLDAFLTLATLASPRMLLKALESWWQGAGVVGGKRTLIVGAGLAGGMVVKELLRNPQVALRPIGFADDDRKKQHHLLNNLPVLGSLAEIRKIVARHDVEEIVIAMPTAPGTVVRKVVRTAMDVGVPTRTVPGLFEILSGRVGISSLRKVEIQDLLRRESIKTDLVKVASLIADKTVLVTGAGGSVGSELCRQVARLRPAQLVLLDHGENAIFDILQELTDEHPALTFDPVIADVRDQARLRNLFDLYRPHAVFHAAAHKHVPLMEENATEAVTNNVLGTRNVVEAAVEVGSAHLVFVSTDKAVRPSSVMGATKRAAELLVQNSAIRHRRNFVSVRFGNVLGSRGSVVPTFLRQIRAGGPVTVTHPDMRRYFMTITEAVQLVLQAAALGRGGELFVLDMGQTVRIMDLACDLIRLSGLKVGRDIEIKFTGMRRGERLFEEMLFRGENALPTDHPKVLRVQNTGLADDIDAATDRLIGAARDCRSDADILRPLALLVPEFVRPTAVARSGELGRRAAATVTARQVHAHRGRPSVPYRRLGQDRRRSQRRVEVAAVEHDRRRGKERRTSESRKAGGWRGEVVAKVRSDPGVLP